MTYIMTLNTHSWMEEESNEKLIQLADRIIEMDYEVVALQEVNQLLDSKQATTDQFFQAVAKQRPIHVDNFAYVLTELLKERGRTYYWSWTASHIGYDRYAEGVAILSKQPIQASDCRVSVEDDFSDYHTRRLLIGKTNLFGQMVRIVSSHYSWWQSDQKAGFSYEWDRTIDYLKQESGPIILMGDLNNAADVSEEGYDYLHQTAPQLHDAYQLASEKQGRYTVEKSIDGWEGNHQQLRIDYIFLTADFTVDTYRVIFDGKTGPVVSDHYGVEVRLVHR